VPWRSFIEAGNFTDYPIWSFGLLMFFAVGIPFFFLTLLGFKLLSPAMKSIGNIAKYTLLALWIIAIAILISIGIKQASEVAFEGKTVKKETINLMPNDTLFVKFRYNDYYTKSIDDRETFKFVQDSANTELIYSNNVRLQILHTDEKLPFIQIEKMARGKSFQDAKLRAEKIKYAIKIEGNHLILDNYLLTEVSNKFRDQEVEIFLYLPEGTLLKPDSSVQDYDRSDDSFFNLHYSSDNYVYKVEGSKVKCLNCPADENEFDDVDTENDSTQTSVIINEDGVTVKGDTISNSKKDFKELKINKDGIIIKTK
jgi:hypothetical protein